MGHIWSFVISFDLHSQQRRNAVMSAERNCFTKAVTVVAPCFFLLHSTLVFGELPSGHNSGLRETGTRMASHGFRRAEVELGRKMMRIGINSDYIVI
jgi:hypothetical protein